MFGDSELRDLRNFYKGWVVMIRALLVSVLFVSSVNPMRVACSQTVSRDYIVSVNDEMPPGTPVKSTGQVVVHEELSGDSVKEKLAFNISFRNISPKPILAYDIVVDVSSENGPVLHHKCRADFLFRKELELAPGAEDLFQLETPSIQTSRPNTQTAAKAEVHVNVEFVEFVDGTAYGKSTWGTSLSQARLEAVDAMRAAIQAFEVNGDAGLRDSLDGALAKKKLSKHGTDVLRGLKAILDSDGSEIAVQRMNSFLEAAQRRGGTS
jgi:hypothetical protein